MSSIADQIPAAVVETTSLEERIQQARERARAERDALNFEAVRHAFTSIGGALSTLDPCDQCGLMLEHGIHLWAAVSSEAVEAALPDDDELALADLPQNVMPGSEDFDRGIEFDGTLVETRGEARDHELYYRRTWAYQCPEHGLGCQPQRVWRNTPQSEARKKRAHNAALRRVVYSTEARRPQNRQTRSFTLPVKISVDFGIHDVEWRGEDSVYSCWFTKYLKVWDATPRRERTPEELEAMRASNERIAFVMAVRAGRERQRQNRVIESLAPAYPKPPQTFRERLARPGSERLYFDPRPGTYKGHLKNLQAAEYEPQPIGAWYNPEFFPQRVSA